MRVFHITGSEQWDRAKQIGSYTGSTRGAGLDEVGFVHCSFADQVERVAGYVYGDDRRTLSYSRSRPTTCPLRYG